ncbi:hypothetical protein ACFYO1_37205 [Nocardia sp. NPDC006044]|uniref:hypothetical protein n=1 Tax=Nocardia sp. NPDC006044 TaxID=3364306 RepID=UPI00369DD6F7
MIKRKAHAATAAIALTAAALGAFGTVAIAAPATAAPAIVRTAAPSAGELNSKLSLVLNSGAARSARAAELEGGEADLAVVERVGGVMGGVPGLTWTVQNANAAGDTLNADLMVTVPGYGTFPPIQIAWRQIDGTWKLTSESVDTIAYYAGQQR